MDSGVDGVDVAKENRFKSPLAGKVRRAIELDGAIFFGLRNHVYLALVLEEKWI